MVYSLFDIIIRLTNFSTLAYSFVQHALPRTRFTRPRNTNFNL